MKKTILSAAALLLVLSCKREEDVKQVMNTAKSSTSSEIVEFFDSATEKAYRFSFSDLYTPEVTYTHEILDGEGAPTDEKTILLLKPQEYQILPSASQSDLSLRFLKPVYVITPQAPANPVALSPGTVFVVSCLCRGIEEPGTCLIGYSYNNPEHSSVTVTCTQGTCKKKCKVSSREELSISAGSAVIYAK
ncbi:MAG: hypothetical protein ACT6QS_01330 [Flavobacteriales bacterium]